MEQITTSAKLLVVVRDATILQSVWSSARCNQWQLDITASAWDALEKLHSGLRADLLLVDLFQGETNGFQILRWLRKVRPDVPMIVLDRVENASRRQEALELGSCDYLVSSLAGLQLEGAIQRNLSLAGDSVQTDITSNDIETLGSGHYFIGLSPGMRKLRAQVGLLARADSPVLIFGAPGSGKETVARLLHRLSVRSGCKFASVDCAALPENLLEKEIFGYRASDGNGSPVGKHGKLELCSGGTLFFHEITEMPRRLQLLLSEALDTGRFIDKETSEVIDLDVRVVAATSSAIDKALSEHRLLPVLFRQMCSYEIKVPSLCERLEEIHSLSHHFMHQLTKQYGLTARAFSAEMMSSWQRYAWPGNMRELEQAVKRYLITGEERLGIDGNSTVSVVESSPTNGLSLSNIAPTDIAKRQSSIGVGGYKSLRSLLQSVREDAERNAIAAALEKTGWNRKAAARLLKISYRSILYKIDQYQMNSLGRPTMHTSERLKPSGDVHLNTAGVNLARVAGRSA